MSTLGPLGARALADQAYEAIKSAILSLKLEPGRRLVERTLAEQLRVSKSPVRDALHRLAGEGLVVQTPYAGMVVCRFDPSFVDELYEVREVLEAMAVSLAIPHLTDSDVDDAEDSFNRAGDAIERDDRVTLGRASDDFHAIFHRRAENRALQTILAGMRDKVRIVTSINWQARSANMWEAHRQHVEIFKLSMEGDATSAAALMQSHVRRGRLEYRQAFDSQGVGSAVGEGSTQNAGPAATAEE